MSNIILKMFRKTIVKMVIGMISSKKFEMNLARRVNRVVNLPGLTEAEEEVIIKNIYKAVKDIVADTLDG